MLIPNLADFPEVAEEQARVATVAKYRLTPKWWQPETSAKPSPGWCSKLLRGAPKKAYYPQPRRQEATVAYDEDALARGEVVEVPTVASRPYFHCDLSQDTITERMGVLFLIGSTNVFLVYEKAKKERRSTIAELIPAVLRQLRSGGALKPQACKLIKGTFALVVDRNPQDQVARDILAAVS